MEGINSYVDYFTPVQHVLLLGFYVVVIAIVTNNWIIISGFTLLTCLGYLIASHLKNAKQLYDSTFLVHVVDVIGDLIDRVKYAFNTAEDKPDKLAAVAHSSPEEEMKEMVRYVVRDFVKSWYCEISNDETFINDVHELLEKASLQCLDRLSGVDKFKVIQDFAKLFHLHLVDIQKARHTLKQQPKYRKKKDRTREFTKMTTLEEAFESLGLYHFAVENRDDELMHLRCATDSLVKLIFPAEVYEVHAMKEMLVNIITCQIMISLVDLISQPYWLHVVLILLLSDEDPIRMEPQTHEPLRREVSSETEVFTQSSATQTADAEVRDSAENADSLRQYPAEVDSSTERLPPIGASMPNDAPIHAPSHAPSHASIQHLGQHDSSSQHECLIPGTSSLSRSHSAVELHRGSSIHHPSSLNASLASTGNLQGLGSDQGSLTSLDASLASSKPAKIFTQVHIDSYETAEEAGGTGSYTLYVIKYSAWYPCRETVSWVHRDDLQVKRRYREFVTLHERLEDVPSLRSSIRGIKGPQRFGITRGPVNASKAEKRRLFLAEYLQILVSVPALCTSQAMREFMAYEGDSQIAFVKNAPEKFPKIDKIFLTGVRSVGGVISKLSNVFIPDPDKVPTVDELEKKRKALETKDLSTWTDEDMPQISFACRSRDEMDFPSRLKACVELRNRRAKQEALDETIEAAVTASESRIMATSQDDEEEDDEDSEFKDPLDEEHFSDHCVEEEDVSASWDAEVPLASTLLDLALQTVKDRDTWLHRQSVVTVAKATITRFLEAFIRCEVSSITTRRHCTYYLHLLRGVVWPGGELDTNPAHVPTPGETAAVREQARGCVLRFFPPWLPYVIGRGEFEHAVDTVMEALDHQQLNRQFVYKLIDLLMSHVLAELSEEAVQEELVADSAKHTAQSHPRLDSVSSYLGN